MAPDILIAWFNGDLLETLGERNMAAARELTKLHEQIVRGSISEVKSHFDRHEPRGEFVLVVGGRQMADVEAWTEQKLAEVIRKELGSGKKAKEIASELSTKSGWQKRVIYQEIIQMQNK